MTSMRVGLSAPAGWLPDMPGWIKDVAEAYAESLRHPAAPKPPPTPKLTLRGTLTLDVVTVPYAPQGGTHGGIAPVFDRQQRPGRPDALINTHDPTPTLALDLTFMHLDFREDVEHRLRKFRRLIDGGEAVLLSGCSPSWAGPWFVTDATEEVQELTPKNRIAKAVVHCTFTKMDKNNINATGPIYGGMKATKPAKTHTYTVKKGDTLPGIAGRLLGDPSLYGIIAAINNLRSTKLKVGQVLKIPDMGKGSK